MTVIKGNILDIGGSIKIPEDQKPIDFKKVRKQVIEKIAEEANARKTSII